MEDMTDEEEIDWKFMCSTSGYDINEGYIIECYDWLSKKHFNWRGLPEDMYISITPENNPYK